MDRYLDEQVLALGEKLTQRLVALASFPTVSGKEYDAQQYICEQLKALQCDQIDVWDPDIESMRGHEAFVSSRNDFAGSPNVVGTWKGSGGGRSLIVNAHIDVVPPGDESEWTVPPFAGTVRNGRIFGRGVSDMKCAHAALLTCVEALHKAGRRLRGDLIFQSVIEEETGGAGTLSCALRGYQADGALIPEPVHMALCPAQQGVLYFRVHVTGKAGHGGERYLGVSAIEKAAFVLEALGELERRRGEEWNHPLYREVPIPFTINVGTIQGGAWPSMVPEHVAFEGRMGVAPGETLQQARCSMEDFLAGLEERDPWFREHPPQVEWLPNRLYSAQIPEDHPLVDTAKAAFAQVMQWQPQMAGTAFGTDASVLTNFAGTPTLVFGPGSVAHCADESIAVDTLLDYTRVMAQLIADWCGSD